MIHIVEVLVIYLLGGLTFIPMSLLIILYLLPDASTVEDPKATIKQNRTYDKQGWIRLTKTYKPKGTDSNAAGIMSYVVSKKQHKEDVYAKLKCGALFIFESPHEEEEQCKLIVPVHNYKVSFYPEKCQDQDIYGKSIAIKLSNEEEELFITCTRPVDKEDWYFGLVNATHMNEPTFVEMMDKTHFDPRAMQTLIDTVQQDAEYREVQWLNAILGRLFLSLYKTSEIKSLLLAKIAKKTLKIKRPSFLGEINVESINLGHAIPFITQIKLLSLTPEGDLMVEAIINYKGGLSLVIQTDFNWTYSSLMKPIRVPLVLAVTLKQLSGKILLKVKPPPTNRCWVGFYELPTMEWEITPIVSDKQIKLSMVTNAIESKIREFVLDNLVLPNMDDFPFCPSDGKGGIFGERVPKPSSPRDSPTVSTNDSILSCATAVSSRGMSLDMLGNKVNIGKVPPKIVPDISQELLSPYRQNKRAESMVVLDSVKLMERGNETKMRGYSSPNIARDRVSSLPSTITPNFITVASSPMASTSSTTGTNRLFTTNIGFRRRVTHSAIMFEQEETEKEVAEVTCFKNTVSMKATQMEETVQDQVEERVKEKLDQYKNEEIVFSDNIPTITIHSTSPLPIHPIDTFQRSTAITDGETSSVDNISAKSSTFTATKSAKQSLISKFNTVSNKISSSSISKVKKNAFYSQIMTGSTNLLYKKNNSENNNSKKVTEEMKQERGRELQKIHEQKMMGLFEKQQQPNSPPTLPPRPTVKVNTKTLDSKEDIPLLSSLDEEESETISSSSSSSSSDLSKEEHRSSLSGTKNTNAKEDHVMIANEVVGSNDNSKEPVYLK